MLVNLEFRLIDYSTVKFSRREIWTKHLCAHIVSASRLSTLVQ